jgi:hypothetical protein
MNVTIGTEATQLLFWDTEIENSLQCDRGAYRIHVTGKGYKHIQYIKCDT